MGRGRPILSLAGIVLAIVTFFAVNLYATLELGSYRLDLTEARLFTLADGTRKLLDSMEEPVTLRFYVSSALTDAGPLLKPIAQRVREMLDTYVSLAKGKLRLEVIDAEPFSPEEDRAAGFGLRGIPYDSAGNRGYFGLVGTNTTDDTSTIPFFNPDREAFLEYDLTRLVYDLAHPEKPKVAVIDGLGMMGGPQTGYRPLQVFVQAQQFFELTTVAGDVARIDDDVTALWIVHPVGLSPKAMYAIDQFVLSGRPALIFVDPLAELMGDAQQIMQTGQLPENTASDLPELFKAWGLELAAAKVVGDGEAAVRVQAMSNGRAVVTQYLPWLGLGAASLDAGDVITGRLERLQLNSAGALLPVAGATTTVTPLIQSSVNTMLIDAVKLQIFPDPVQLLDDFVASGLRYTLAARVAGTAKTAFPDGPPREENAPADAEVPAPLKEAAKPLNLIVVADADMLADANWLNIQDVMGAQLATPTANNGDFAINALENLTGGEALAELRGRGLSNRPFTRIEALQAEADAMYRSTEKKLSEELQAVQEKLANLEVDSSAGQVLLTPEQQDSIRKFRDESLRIRGLLREVQHALGQDIERLQAQLIAANTGLVPAVVAGLAIILALLRRLRAGRRRSRA